MVSKASEDLPDPDNPVITTRLSRGKSTSMFLRLCSRAPRIRICCCMPQILSRDRSRRHRTKFPVTQGKSGEKSKRRRYLSQKTPLITITHDVVAEFRQGN